MINELKQQIESNMQEMDCIVTILPTYNEGTEYYKLHDRFDQLYNETVELREKYFKLNNLN